MKKLTMAFITMIALSVNASALSGTIDFVKLHADGTIEVKIAGNKKALVGTPDAIKAMYATILTAQSKNATVDAWGGEYDSASGWATIQVITVP